MQQLPRDQALAPRAAFEELPDSLLEIPVGAWIDKQVERFSDRPAVSDPDTQLTYRELNERANRLAHALLDRLGARSEPVAIFLEHSPELIIAMLAVVKAGKATLVADPTQPPARLDYLREDSGFRAVVTSAGFADRLQPEEVVVVDSSSLADRPSTNPIVAVTPETLCSLLYTSGSTGQPKAVCRPHFSVMDGVLALNRRVRIDRDDRLAVVHAMAAGTLVGTVFGALSHGACLNPYDLKTEGIHHMAAWLRSQRVTILSCVGSVWRQFGSLLQDGETLPDLRNVRIGGESIFASDIELFDKFFEPPASLRVGMGASECGEIACWFFYPGDPLPADPVPIGTPSPPVSVELQGEDGSEVPAGEIGEIVVRSPGVTLGYWQRPELTREKFRPDPDGGRRAIYRTGDLGRMRPDGYFEHQGRRDSQVQIRGNRVEPAEIEAALQQIESIAESVVVLRGARDEAALVAYIIGAEGDIPTTSQLRRTLLQKLPEHMVPTHFVRLDEMPRTSTGKIDRQALPAPDSRRPDLDEPYVAPANALEGLLAGLFTELLGVEQIGVNDNFFDLGGQSLKAARLAARVWQVLASEVRLVRFLEDPTVARLSALLTTDPENAQRVRRIAELHSRVAEMSDDEVDKALETLGMEVKA